MTKQIGGIGKQLNLLQTTKHGDFHHDGLPAVANRFPTIAVLFKQYMKFSRCLCLLCLRVHTVVPRPRHVLNFILLLDKTHRQFECAFLDGHTVLIQMVFLLFRIRLGLRVVGVLLLQ